MKLLTFICRRCGAEFNEDTCIPVHIGSGGHTYYMGKVTGDVLCDYCLEEDSKQDAEAYNTAMESSFGDSW